MAADDATISEALGLFWGVSNRVVYKSEVHRAVESKGAGLTTDD